jgi:hypothetical protein
VIGTDTSWPMLTAASRRSCGERPAGRLRLAHPGAGLFLFTFSRHTLPAEAEPVAGEPFVFTQFSGERQCFLTREEIADELGRAGFAADPTAPLRELNRSAGLLRAGSGPVIYEGAFRFTPI